ncbi:MAG: ATP-binding protein [Spirochaetaceae bacterium]|nr:ATP-binding protein [Spirochaetaceae bacterium]
MKRKIIKELFLWKDSKNRSPLLLLGARQVGKTWILREFGKTSFSKVHYFDLSERNSTISGIFKGSLDPLQIIGDLEVFLEKRINIKEDFVIFDEIQDLPSALSSLKYFKEKMPELHLACAGSLLGVGLINESFPVGKVDYLDMYPLSFDEFLKEAAGDFIYAEYENAVKLTECSNVFHEKLMVYLRDYWITGGLPGVVNGYMEFRANRLESYMIARKIQNNLIKDYLNDFSRHAGKINSNHIKLVFENIPTQLAANVDGSVNRYIFKDIISGKKGFAAVEGPISWLEHAGLVYKVPICNRSAIPLKAYTKPNIFKLHLFDIGLLGAMLELSPKTILDNNYGSTKGYFAESFALAELKKSMKFGIYGWMERNSEIEFLTTFNDKIVPIEVKSGSRTKAKSLAQYLVKYNPKLAFKLMDKVPESKGGDPVQIVPLYFAGRLQELVSVAGT